MKQLDYWNSRWNQNSQRLVPKNFEEYLSGMNNIIKAMLRELKKIIDSLNVRNKKVLDIGGGKGYLLNYLFDKNNEKYLIDISPSAVEFAVTNFRFHAEVCDIIKKLPFEGKYKFDVIISTEVVEHIHPLDIEIFFERISCLLTTNGYFIMTTPYLFSFVSRIKFFLGKKPIFFTWDKTHILPLTMNEILNLCLKFRLSPKILKTTNIMIPIKRGYYIKIPLNFSMGEHIILVAQKE